MQQQQIPSVYGELYPPHYYHEIPDRFYYTFPAKGAPYPYPPGGCPVEPQYHVIPPPRQPQRLTPSRPQQQHQIRQPSQQQHHIRQHTQQQLQIRQLSQEEQQRHFPPGTVGASIGSTQPRVVRPYLDDEIKRLRRRNNGFMIFSGIVTFVCNIVFGAVGLGLGVWADYDLLNGEKNKGKCKSITGCVFSIIGILITATLVALFFIYYTEIYNYFYPE